MKKLKAIEDAIVIPDDFLNQLMTQYSDELAAKPVREIEKIEMDLLAIDKNTAAFSTHVDEALEEAANLLISKQAYHADEINRKRSLKQFIRARLQEIKFSEKGVELGTTDGDDGLDDISTTRTYARDYDKEVPVDDKVLEMLKQVIMVISARSPPTKK